MDIRDKIITTASTLENEYVKTFRSKGGKVFAGVCTFTPAEVIHAAGALPLRIRGTGSKATDKAEVYYSPTHCSFARHTLNQGLSGHFSFCDGIIFVSSCDHARRLYDNWGYTDSPPSVRYMMTVPHVGNEQAVIKYAEDLRRLAAFVGEQTGKTVTADSLHSSIKAYNEQRRLIGKLYEMRKRPHPAVKGTTMLYLWQTLTAIPVEEGNAILKELIETVDQNPDPMPEGAVRLFLASTHLEDPERMAAVESGRALIVNDTSCFGNGHFSAEVSEEGDPFLALAQRTLLRPSCPNIVDGFRKRLDNVEALAKEWNCDGIVFDHLQFCTIGDAEAYIYRQEFTKKNIPYISLQHELYGGGAGQVKTRMEAFTEQIANIKRNNA
jgi:benzoyl-CoA reductase/2-hydroxyglutaryl-CoA dehydratase subunit BcrC/BadD/HgdB